MTFDKLKELVEQASGEGAVLDYHFKNKCGWRCGSNQTELYFWTAKKHLITSCKKCLNKESPSATKLTAKEVFIVRCLY